MDESGFSLSRRNSLESSTTSEFEVVSRERSVSGSTVEAGNPLEDERTTEASSPPASLRIPALYSESTKSDDVLPDSSIPKPSWSIDDDLFSLANSISQLSESCVSDVSMMGRDTMGMLEQVFHELTLIKGRNNLLERTVEQANEWRDKASRLEEQNRILQKSLRTSKNRVEQLTQEVDNFKQREEKLTSSLNEFEERQTQRSGTSWYYQVMALCIIVAAIGMYIDCYAQLLREHRASEQLKEQVQLMNELVEKLEAEHAAEYKRRLEEISKQMANDMSASIALAHKQVFKKRGQYFFRTLYSRNFISYRITSRELEHERLIEAYREKMLLYDDLSALRKEKLRGKKKSATWFR